MGAKAGKWMDTGALALAVIPFPWLAERNFGLQASVLIVITVALGYLGLVRWDRWSIYAFVAYSAAFQVAFAASLPGADTRFVLVFGALAVPFVLGVTLTARDPHRRWTVLLLSVGVLIAYFSGPFGGGGRMMWFFAEVMGLAEEDAQFWVLVVRKTVHVLCYGVLAFSGLLAAHTAGRARAGAIGLGLALSLSHAAFDEGRQTLYKERTGTAVDVLIDAAGAVLFTVAGSRWIRRRERSE